MTQFGIGIRARLIAVENGVPLERVAAAERGTAHLDEVMAELLKLEGCRQDLSDSAISFDASTGEALFEVVVTADSPGNAVDVADSSIRAAIHAAGGFTPGWSRGGSPAPGAIEYDVINMQAEAVPA